MRTRANALLHRTSTRQRALLAACLTVAVADLTRGARAERSWLDISEDRFGAMEKRLGRLESEREQLARDNADLARRNTDMAADAGRAIDAQAGEIERLRAQIAAIETAKQGQGPPQAATPAERRGLPTAVLENPFERARNGLAPEVRRRTDPAGPAGPAATGGLIHFTLAGREGGSRDLARYIPAGAYAPAEVISGVDAGVGIATQADPRPVLFRITGPAVTAAFGSAAFGSARQTADIAGCTVTGAAIGDLSSEKVYVRLQTMTCSRAPGKVFETEVQGYMAGAGKAGVRGVVVSREGALVTQSFLAGAVGGIGGAAAQSLQPETITTGTAIATGPRALQDIVKGGLGQGLDNAGDKAADYLIRRAEQYQPIIVMQAGTRVELVFIAGVSLKPDMTVAPQPRGTNE
ncbi:MAG: hypothetical protein GKS00_01800 [Alphaproteobacteria bacterium]|nr:hypothetical protein [Alphaproteobacteria bacterium]